MKSVVAQAAVREPLEVRRLARPTECTGGAEAHIVDQDDQYVRRILRRPDGLDRREMGVRVLRVVGNKAGVRPVGDRQDRSLVFVLLVRHLVVVVGHFFLPF